MTENHEQQVLAYVQSKGWRYQRSGEWMRVESCPLCGSKSRWPFVLNLETGAGTCHHCNWTGGIFVLRKALGDVLEPAGSRGSGDKVTPIAPETLWRDAHAALVADEETLAAYMASRCLERETVERFRIGLRAEPGKPPVIVVPYFRKGRLQYVKCKIREPDGGKKIWREPKGTKALLFNLDGIADHDTVIVTEGEEDCMVLTQLGLPNVVSVPDGANVSKAAQTTWLDALEPFREIIIAFDADEVGQRAAKTMAEMLGPTRCPIVEWPHVDGCKDPTDFARAGRHEDILAAIQNARIQPHPKIQHIGDEGALEELRRDHENPHPHGLPTGWRSLDEYLGGIRPSEITIVTGHTNSGKSAFVNNLTVQLASQGTAVVAASLELDRRDYRWRLMQRITGKFPFLRKEGYSLTMTVEEREHGFSVLRELPIYFVNHFGGMNVAEFTEIMRYAARRYHASVFVLDHLHFLCQGAGDRERFVLSEAIHRLKLVVTELRVSLILVVHPSRHARDKESPDGTDLHGSASLEQVTDNLVTVARKRDVETGLTGMATIAVKKLRRGFSGRLGSFDLDFDRPSDSFVERYAEPDRIESFDDRTLASGAGHLDD